MSNDAVWRTSDVHVLRATFFKPYNQSPAGRRMVTSDSVFFVSGVMLSFLCDSAGRCHGRGGEESFSVRGRGRTAVRFSHALLSAETLLVYVRIPKVSSSYISHGATRRNEKNLALSHVHAVFSQSPPSFFLFFFLFSCVWVEKKPGRAGR